jgi:hypothetical protein
LLEVPEYDLTRPSTLTVLNESDVISDGEAKWFRRELQRIAGKSRFGEPNLVMRWGPTYEDPMQADKVIKYLDFGFAGEQLGERRWIIEIWRSPEFLKRSGRYQTLIAPDVVQEFYFCKGCDAEIICSRETLAFLGSVPPCDKCGSKRSYTRENREAGGKRLLNQFPSDGCYDYWLRLERADLTYHPPDNEALEVARALWQWELTPQNERDSLEQADREIERRQVIQWQRQQQGGAIYTGAVHPQFIPR